MYLLFSTSNVRRDALIQYYAENFASMIQHVEGNAWVYNSSLKSIELRMVAVAQWLERSSDYSEVASSIPSSGNEKFFSSSTYFLSLRSAFLQSRLRNRLDFPLAI